MSNVISFPGKLVRVIRNETTGAPLRIDPRVPIMSLVRALSTQGLTLRHEGRAGVFVILPAAAS